MKTMQEVFAAAKNSSSCEVIENVMVKNASISYNAEKGIYWCVLRTDHELPAYEPNKLTGAYEEKKSLRAIVSQFTLANAIRNSEILPSGLAKRIDTDATLLESIIEGAYITFVVRKYNEGDIVVPIFNDEGDNDRAWVAKHDGYEYIPLLVEGLGADAEDFVSAYKTAERKLVLDNILAEKANEIAKNSAFAEKILANRASSMEARNKRLAEMRERNRLKKLGLNPDGTPATGAASDGATK